MTLAELIKKAKQQDFGADDSVIASSINHPIKGAGKLADWITKQTKTASGIPEEYDNQNPLLSPSPNAQSQAAFDLAGLAQVGSMPFAPKSAGGTLGTLINQGVPETEYSKAHQIAQKNAVDMLGLAPDNTAMERAKAMGFDTPAYHKTDADIRQFTKKNLGKNTKGNAATKEIEQSAKLGHWFGTGPIPDSMPGSVQYPVLLKIQNPSELTNRMSLIDALEERGLKGQNKYLDIAGNDAILMRKDNETKAGSIVMRGNKNIRSKFAAFDPAKKNSSDLLASKLLPATMLGYGMYQDQQKLKDMK